MVGGGLWGAGCRRKQRLFHSAQFFFKSEYLRVKVVMGNNSI